MNRTLTAAAGAVTAALIFTGCTSSPTVSSDKPKPSYATDSIEALCRAQHWPQPMPQVTGKKFDPLGKDLQCFDHLKALAPDGHDVMNDSAADTQSWIVTTSQPESGAKVKLSTAITLKLREPNPDTPTPSAASTAQTHPAAAPAQTTNHTTAPPIDDHGSATALCNDGTLSYSQHHQGTCSHHHGVSVWYQ